MTYLEKLNRMYNTVLIVGEEPSVTLFKVLIEEAERRQVWELAVERELRNLNPGMGDLP